jgi:hypothetical protein
MHHNAIRERFFLCYEYRGRRTPIQSVQYHSSGFKSIFHVFYVLQVSVWLKSFSDIVSPRINCCLY